MLFASLSPSLSLLAGALCPVLVFLTLRKLSVHGKLSCAWAQLLRSCKHRFLALAYLIQGPSIINAAYTHSSKQPFVVETPSNKHIMITSEALIRELAEAPNDFLSLHAIAHELLQPKYTMQGFQWKDQRGVDGTGFVRALRSMLTSNLPVLLPRLRGVLAEMFDAEIRSSPLGKNGGHLLRVFPSIKRVVARTNCGWFFGEELSEHDDFVKAALQFPQDVIFAAEFLRLSPTFMSPLIAYMTTHGHRAAKLLVRYLEPIIESRMELRGKEVDCQLTPANDKPVDCIQWVIDTSPRKNPWSTSRMIGELIALWFGSVHQLAMVGSFALDHLSIEPRAADVLRQELMELLPPAKGVSVEVDDLPLLNSFLMESSRVSGNDAVSCRRKALRRFSFSDGTAVERGDWACVPLLAMLHDADNYAYPERFDAYRFVSESKKLLTSKPLESLGSRDARRFTDVTAKWPIWGIGKTACPGRFYASCVLKLLLIHVLDNYDVQMEANGRRSASWRSSIVPLGSARLEFTPRSLKDRSTRFVIESASRGHQGCCKGPLPA